MAGINKVILVGNLGRDPETRFMQDGTAVTNFSLATSESWKDKTSGEQREKVEWHRCVAWRRLAEICGEYLSKGQQVYVEGKLQTREWEDKEGVKRYTTEIVLSTMQMLGRKGENQSQGGQGQNQDTFTPPGPGQNKPGTQQPLVPDPAQDVADDDAQDVADDDIPF